MAQYILIFTFISLLTCKVSFVIDTAGGLACRLKCPPGRSKPPTAGLSHGKWEVDPTELTLMEELGSGQFGVVRRAKWKGIKLILITPF